MVKGGGAVPVVVQRCRLSLQARQLPLDVVDEQIRHVVTESSPDDDA